MQSILNKILVTGAVVLGAMALAHAAPSQASTYILTQDGCTNDCGTGPFGTVSVTQTIADQLSFSVVLNSGYSFRGTNDNQHHALAFSLVGNPDLNISGLPNPLTKNGLQLAGTNNASPFGLFDYAINYPKPKPQDQTPAPTSFTFTAQATGLTLASLEANSMGVWFATDVVSPNGASGSVAAVPEPSEWAMLLAGLAVVGFIANRRRNKV